MGPKLFNCCRLEQVGTKYGKMLKRIQVLQDGMVSAKEARNLKIEGQRRRITRKEYKWLLIKFEIEVFMAQKGLWNLARENILQDRREGDVIREYEAMHEDNLPSSRLREDGKNKEEIVGEVGKETEEETGKKRKREEERRERDGDRQKKVYQICFD